MPEVLGLQDKDNDTPEEEKASQVSYVACNNSYTSQAWCWRF